MGGNAFKMAKRISKDKYYDLIEEIGDVLHEATIEVFRFTKQIEEKEDFGDIDVLIHSGYSIDQKFIKDNFGTDDVITSSNVISFLYKETQIDFIKVDFTYIDTITLFYDYNDLGNLIGRMAKFYNCKLRPDGLFLDIYTKKKDRLLTKIHLTDDINIILKFLDLDLGRYQKGFKTYKEAFDFIIKSKCYNHEYYTNREYVNSDSWKRDRVRKTYNLFLDYIMGIEKVSDPKKEFLDNVRIVHNFFRELNIKEIIRDAKREEKINRKNKRFLNCEIYTKITGLEGKELGKFIFYMKSSFDKRFGRLFYKHKRKDIKDFIMNKKEEYLVWTESSINK